MDCVACGRNVKPEFNYFCRGCYRNLKYKLGVSRSDFRKYLRYGLGVQVHISEHWDFRQVYDFILVRHPTLYKLAVLIESVLFLKFVSRKGMGLKLS